ncbi:Lrp/AsnC family transcriptional regulator [Paracoccus denitrificans]|jgi:DNA-binding Lrp family transcriptional regulator|uniref:Siroheme decarboxylase NirG subunit n=1 Tax=Paracoccus denitrificans (strain Pd 1222) TaxID=318586 RepID=A1B4Y5_PARDP|nr:AsnC family transcriptional regulator [Paracoccus denitrificans]ABL70579.1 transcriptional regulator, AsnC family [Paracoccus denitrificans PD1222]MBB4627462.1 DNA-binding Lrp family transcriptional regulator [Paracoccus denitrificans]MCU7429431.1 AsnC family transcriptional regulator [Paracoccus denitrificans]QAR25912.1 Lrp/AsnC family transcriptional regulator [Paracoccus denitrificans]UPV94818.1 AsnC family transcriptional regulator [Paracoccus denitrificans]
MRRQTLPPEALDDTDRAILNNLQEGFPLTPRPFDDAGAALGLTGTALIGRLERLREIGAITRFGPFYDAAAMGGAFCLCALSAPEADFDRIADLVNAHPEVAHNYARDHALNMWFVLATATPEGIAEIAERIEAETGLTVWRFPKLREFFIGFRVAA